MAKDSITRAEVHDKHMKEVIIRLDYAGVSDVSELVKIFDKTFPKTFKNRSDVYNTEYKMTLSQDVIKDISDTVHIPVNVLQKEKIVRYTGMRNVHCNVILDISQYYLCMTIECDENYDGLDKYVECFKGSITAFSSRQDYFQPKRLGLRKIRVESKKTIQDFNKIFESFVLNIPNYSICQKDNLKSTYIDVIEDKTNKGLKFNICRSVGRYDAKQGGVDMTEYRAVLDIDADYKDEKLDRISDLLTQANLKEFEVYKSCMKEEFLRGAKE